MKPFLFIIFASLLVGCSHSVILPGSYRQRPKTIEKQWGGEVSFGAQQTVEVEIFDDITTDPPSRTDGTELGFSKFIFPVLPFVDLNFGILKKLDVYYASGLGIRYQWLGDEKSIGWNATVFAGAAGVSSSTSSQDSSGASAKTKLSGVEYGISFGHYWTSLNGLYVSYGTTDGKSNTKITQTTKSFEYDDKYEHTILSLGGTYGNPWYLWLEMSKVKTKWKFDEGGSDTQDNNSFILGTGVHF